MGIESSYQTNNHISNILIFFKFMIYLLLDIAYYIYYILKLCLLPVFTN